MTFDANPKNIVDRFLKVSAAYLSIPEKQHNSFTKERRIYQRRIYSRSNPGRRQSDLVF